MTGIANASAFAATAERIATSLDTVATRLEFARPFKGEVTPIIPDVGAISGQLHAFVQTSPTVQSHEQAMAGATTLGNVYHDLHQIPTSQGNLDWSQRWGVVQQLGAQRDAVRGVAETLRAAAAEARAPKSDIGAVTSRGTFESIIATAADVHPDAIGAVAKARATANELVALTADMRPNDRAALDLVQSRLLDFVDHDFMVQRYPATRAAREQMAALKDEAVAAFMDVARLNPQTHQMPLSQRMSAILKFDDVHARVQTFGAKVDAVAQELAHPTSSPAPFNRGA